MGDLSIDVTEVYQHSGTYSESSNALQDHVAATDVSFDPVHAGALFLHQGLAIRAGLDQIRDNALRAAAIGANQAHAAGELARSVEQEDDLTSSKLNTIGRSVQ